MPQSLRYDSIWKFSNVNLYKKEVLSTNDHFAPVSSTFLEASSAMAQPPANVNNYGYSPGAPTPPEQVQPNFAPQPPMGPAPYAPPPPNFAPQQQMAPVPAAPPPPMSPAYQASPMAQTPNYNPPPYGQPTPYGQPPPPYTPMQTPPTSPYMNRPYAQSPMVRPVVVAPRNDNFMCCEYMVAFRSHFAYSLRNFRFGSRSCPSFFSSAFSPRCSTSSASFQATGKPWS